MMSLVPLLALTVGLADPVPPPPLAPPLSPLALPASPSVLPLPPAGARKPADPAAPNLAPTPTPLGPTGEPPAAAGRNPGPDHAAALNQPACPGPTAHPFRRLPRICPVGSCPCAPEPGGMAHAGAGPAAPAGGKKGPSETVAWVKVFEPPAFVPLPRFSAEGCPVPADGLLVYEGMRLVVYQDGGYELAFTATVPDMPVTLRLQLVFQNGPDPTDARTITLPPIRLAPPRDARPGDVDAFTFHVAHRGYSSLFQWGQVTDRAPLYRVGTARFGTPVALEDPNR